MSLSTEILDMYAEAQPTAADSVRGQIRSIEGALQRVAETRRYLHEQMKKCGVAERALLARLAEAREAVAKLEADRVSPAGDGVDDALAAAGGGGQVH